MDHEDKTTAEEAERVVFVSGPSGAGRSTAIRALEDLGFEAIDNLPLSLLPRLLDGPPPTRPLALGTDPRNRDYSAQALIAAVDRLAADPRILADLVYLDCATDVLVRRYSETRRRHPLAPEDRPILGIELEQDLLAPVRARAGILIDTSDMTPHELRAEVQRWFAPGGQQLALSVQSFSYKRGLPTGADLVFDCRFLRNPYWDADLRSLDGRDAAVVDYIADDARFAPFLAQVTQLVETLLPAYQEEGKAHLTVAFGCTGGQHRSVVVTEKLATHLAQAGWQVSKRHREIERRAVTRAP
ncbi:RNase adapter RapZ [Nioella sp. MMSF_3534]|uniref:RNase adapter RapZ n=1 Tax=Nioella sp. MMSF_3534 TaxID=3046720 RepID=UPI00273D0E80|nr:RNase adapter RapZ [Nioella sp. MMSF_3534]